MTKKTVAKQATTPIKEDSPTDPKASVETVAPAETKSTEESVDVVTLSDDFKKTLVALSSVQANIKQLTAEVKRLEKRATKEIREASKKSTGKGKGKDAPKAKRPPSGFAKPSLISDELCTFLGKDKGTEMARTEVTKHITGYIKDNGLQNPENKRQILPDSNLKKLLNAGDSDTVTYFNLQKYMKHHFPTAKTTKATGTVSTSA